MLSHSMGNAQINFVSNNKKQCLMDLQKSQLDQLSNISPYDEPYNKGVTDDFCKEEITVALIIVGCTLAFIGILRL